MTRKQTSAKVSKLAAKYLAMPLDEAIQLMRKSPNSRLYLARDIRTLAASCLSQDEVKGGKPLPRFTGEITFTEKLPKFTKAEQAALERGEVVFRTEKRRRAKP